MTRQALRRKLQHIRHNLSQDYAEQAGMAVADAIEQRLRGLEPAQTTVAVYHSFAGELPTRAVIERLWKSGFATVLPVLHPFAKGHLLFLRYTPTTRMTQNKYGIEEPELRIDNVVPLNDIDVLLLPLVGFDTKGNRLGMGGGYYDRTLAQWHNGYTPHLLPIGLSYDEQQVSELPVEAWDIPLPEIMTPTKHWRF